MEIPFSHSITQVSGDYLLHNENELAFHHLIFFYELMLGIISNCISGLCLILLLFLEIQNE